MPGNHPSLHAREKPDALAMVIADTGETLIYRELEAELRNWVSTRTSKVQCPKS